MYNCGYFRWYLENVVPMYHLNLHIKEYRWYVGMFTKTHPKGSLNLRTFKLLLFRYNEILSYMKLYYIYFNVSMLYYMLITYIHCLLSKHGLNTLNYLSKHGF